jgi:hypothetical protein
VFFLVYAESKRIKKRGIFMKNFLQVLLVGTILVSAGDVFAAAVGWGSPATKGLESTVKEAETAVMADIAADAVSTTPTVGPLVSNVPQHIGVTYWNPVSLVNETHTVTVVGNTATALDHVGNTVTVATMDSAGNWSYVPNDVLRNNGSWISNPSENLMAALKAENAGGLTFGELAHEMGLEIPAPTPIEINPDLATLGKPPVVFTPGEGSSIHNPVSITVDKGVGLGGTPQMPVEYKPAIGGGNPGGDLVIESPLVKPEAPVVTQTGGNAGNPPAPQIKELDPSAGALGSGGAAPTVLETRTTEYGAVIEKMSDGTYRNLDGTPAHSYDIQQAGFDTGTTGSSVAIQPKVEYASGVNTETVGYVERGADGKYYDGSGKSYTPDSNGNINVEGTDYQVRQEVTTSTTKTTTTTTTTTVQETVVTETSGNLKYNPKTGKFEDGTGKSYEIDKQGKIHVDGTSYQVFTSIPASSVAPSGFSAQFVGIEGDVAKLNIGGIEYTLPKTDIIGKVSPNGMVSITSDMAKNLSMSFSSYLANGFGNFTSTFSNFFGAAVDMVKMPFTVGAKLIQGVKGLFGDSKAAEGFGKTVDGIVSGFKGIPDNFANVVWGGGMSDQVAKVYEAQKAVAEKMTPAQIAKLKSQLALVPAWIQNAGEYALLILQTVEAGNQDDTTKSVKVKSENALLNSQGSTTDSTVGTTLDGTNMASAAVAMATLLKNNPVDLNLLKESDLDLTKDKDQKTLRQRRDLLLQMYAVSAQVIAEGSMAISSDFYDRINALSETLSETTGSLGAASVLNDSERYPYFEMVRQTALSATQLGLKGAATLPNLQAMHSYHINTNK